jgi:hypothetical protein
MFPTSEAAGRESVTTPACVWGTQNPSGLLQGDFCWAVGTAQLRTRLQGCKSYESRDGLGRAKQEPEPRATHVAEGCLERTLGNYQGKNTSNPPGAWRTRAIQSPMAVREFRSSWTQPRADRATRQRDRDVALGPIEHDCRDAGGRATQEQLPRSESGRVAGATEDRGQPCAAGPSSRTGKP